MKKFTSILLSLAIVLSLMPMNIFAAETTVFTDIKGDEYYAKSAMALSELGILDGYDDGSFGADKTITRAEMAAIICRIMGVSEEAETEAGTTMFDDVAADHWASGYINMASKKGIIEGDGNGKFRPEDNVKFEEAVKMIVCTLGLDEDITVDPSDWSKAYLDVAAEKGITDNAQAKKGEPATRGDIAVISYNGVGEITNESEVAAPVASVEGGEYKKSQKVELTSATEGAKIYYTTDGSTPTIKSKLYTKAITVGKKMTLKAIAVFEGIVSEVMSVDYVVKVASGGGGGGGGSSSSTPDPFEAEAELSANEYTYSVAAETTTVYVYVDIAKANNTISKVELFKKSDAEEESVATLKDSGNFEADGDDFSNDNKFSAKLSLDLSAESKTTYFAKVYSGSESIKTDEIVIEVKELISEEDIDNMNEVDNAIKSMIEANTALTSENEEEKAAAVAELVSSIADEENVADDSVIFNEESGVVEFEYSNGCFGAVMIDEFNDEDATDDEVKNTPSDLLEKRAEQNAEYESGVFNVAPMSEGAASGGGAVGGGGSTLKPVGEPVDEIGRALVLNAFEDIPFRRTYYEALETDWDSKGLATDLDTDVTVDDLKGIGDYNVVVMASHGSTYKGSPVICLNETVTKEKSLKYAYDITNKNIVAVTLISGERCYWVLPSFFANNFGAGDLDIEILFSECCNFMGYGGNVRNDFPNALASKGVDTIIGYHNSVLAVYSRNMMKETVDGMIEGETASESFDDAKEMFGDADGHGAYPIYSGDLSTVLDLNLKNGDFEQSVYPTKWGTDGDVRTLVKLGDIVPVSKKRMAIISTGVGSGESDHAGATEGSTIYQRFRIPESAETLSFSYNVVSEEPMEYVDSEYDDTFFAAIDIEEDSVELAKETVNTSVWKKVENIDFAGGDDTVYETGWTTINYDVTELRGKVVTLKFVVFDKGDSVYDTAVLIDNVNLTY